LRDNGWRCVCPLGRRVSGEFGCVAIAKKWKQGDETDEDGDGNGKPADARRGKRIMNASPSIEGSIGRGEKVWQEMEWETAQDGADASEDAGPEKFVEELFGLPALGRVLAGDGADFRRCEFGKLPGQRTCDGRSFPPSLEALREVSNESVGMERGIGFAATDVENAAGTAFVVLPCNINALRGEQGRHAIGELDRADLIVAKSEFGFFTAIADAIGAQEKVANVPVGVASVDAGCGGG